MLHQFHGGLMRNRFLPGKSKKQRRSRFTLLGACLDLWAIEIGISSGDENNRAVLGQKFHWFLVPVCPQRAC